MRTRKVLLNAGLFLIAIVCGVLFSLKPWQLYNSQRRTTDEQVKEMKEAERAHVQDMLTDARYGTSAGREELARKQGFRKAGEVPVQP